MDTHIPIWIVLPLILIVWVVLQLAGLTPTKYRGGPGTALLGLSLAALVGLIFLVFPS